MELKITPSGQTIVKPTALGPGANTDTKLLIYRRDFKRAEFWHRTGSVFVSMERDRLDGATDSERTATVFGRKQASRKNIVVSTGDDAFFTCQENSNMIKSVTSSA